MKFILFNYKNVDLVNLAQIMVHWRALVNTVMHIQVSEKAGKFLTR